MLKYFMVSWFIIAQMIILPQNMHAKIFKIFPDNFPTVESSISIYNDNKEPVGNLSSSNFSVFVDDKQSEIISSTTYKSSGKGLYIMLCIDLSKTMQGEPLKTTKNAIYKFLDNVRGVDKIAIMGFADDAFLISDFTNDMQYLKDQINNLKVQGSNTALNYGIYKGLEKLSSVNEDAGKILLVMGDGKDENKSNSYSTDDVINKANENGIPIFTIGYSKIEKTYLQTLEKISDKTGGNFYNTPSDNQLEMQYKKLYDQVLNIYLVQCKVVNVSGDGKDHSFNVTVNNGNIKCNVSKSFIAPGGINAYLKKEPINTLYFIIGGIVIIGIILSIFFVLKTKKKNKLIERENRSTEQKRIDAQLEAERKQRLDVQMDLEKLKKDVEKSGKDEQILRNEDAKRKGTEKDDDRTRVIRTNNSGKLNLLISEGSQKGKNILITENQVTIGRDPSNSVVLEDKTVSKHHAIVSLLKGSYYIENKSTTNGTFINGHRINQPVKLNDGDLFKFGGCSGRIIIK